MELTGLWIAQINISRGWIHDDAHSNLNFGDEDLGFGRYLGEICRK
jgi:hypothetical protein